MNTNDLGKSPDKRLDFVSNPKPKKEKSFYSFKEYLKKKKDEK